MKTIGLEEHFITPEVMAANWALPPGERDLAFHAASEGDTSRRLLGLGDERIKAMEQTGLDVQVLSLTTPGVQNLTVQQAVSLQRQSNDVLAQTVAANPNRFQGLASLATCSPTAAVEELVRAVKELGLNGAMLFGRTGETHLDHPDFWPIYEAAEALRVPLHLHPQSPPLSVRTAYYSGFDPALDDAFATFGLGWHYDAGVEFIRMVLGGVFDRFPDLQIIVGHWGEVMLFFLDRIQQLARAAKLPRPLTEYVQGNLYVAPSGLLSPRYLRWAMEIVGPERLLFSTDYPF